MWAGSHIGVGAVGYELVREEPWWFKVLYVIFWGFITHFLLDRAAAYHELSWPFNGWEILFLLVNAAIIGGVWWFSAREKRGWKRIFPPHLLAGFVAWWIWDVEWLFVMTGLMSGSFLHSYILGFQWAGGATAPPSALVECALMLLLTLGAAPLLIRRRKNRISK